MKLKTFAAALLVALAAFALPASAAKIYTMVVQSTGTSTVTVTLHNVTPENNSVINSFIINKPSGASGLSYLSSSDPTTVAVPDGNGGLKINGFNGLKSANKNPNTLTLNLGVTWSGSPPGCGSSVAWTAIAYTGNFSSTTFQLVDAGNGNTPISSVPQSLNCFTLTGLPGEVLGGTSNKTYTAVLTNTNGAGGPSISSIAIAAGGAGVTATVPAISPALAPGNSTNVTVTVNTACGASAGGWSATGTGSGGATFAGEASAASSYTVKDCVVAFVQAPPVNVGLNKAIEPAITVSATNGAGQGITWNPANATWTLVPVSGAAGSVNNASGTCATVGTCTFAQLNVTGSIGGNYKLQVSIPGIGSALSSAFYIWGGTLGCDAANRKGGELDPSDLKTYVKASDQGKWGLVRGSNKDLLPPCEVVPYTFNLTINTSPQLASFIVPDPSITGQKIAAEYVVVWGRVPVVATGDDQLWTKKRPLVSWGTPSFPVPGTDDFVPGLACVKDPADLDVYPNGFASVPQSELASLLPTIPDAPPFNALSPTTYPQYQPGQKAKICIAQHGWTAVGTDPDTGLTLIQYWTKAIDQTDGFMSLDN